MKSLIIWFITLFALTPAITSAEVNVYSYRQSFLVEPLFAKFTAMTGIKVNTIFAAEGLIQKMQMEGRNSPADLLLTSNSTRLVEAKELGLTQSIQDPILEEAVPSTFRDPAGNWFGLTIRARLIYASKERVQENDITYEELTSSKWNRRICSRSGKNDYNIDLIASMVAHHGLEETKLWLKGVKENLARRPQGNDRAQVKAIYVGQCDISLGNSYYFGAMMTDPEQKEWARSVKLLFPNQENRGTHVNISGMALTKYAPNQEDAIKLMHFLVSEEAQKIYAEVNYEFPVRQGVALSPLLKPYEGFISDKIPLIEFIQYRRDASILVDQVGFDE
jgi:iron(III) transport system substrate-binding protein